MWISRSAGNPVPSPQGSPNTVLVDVTGRRHFGGRRRPPPCHFDRGSIPRTAFVPGASALESSFLGQGIQLPALSCSIMGTGESAGRSRQAPIVRVRSNRPLAHAPTKAPGGRLVAADFVPPSRPCLRMGPSMIWTYGQGVVQRRMARCGRFRTVRWVRGFAAANNFQWWLHTRGFTLRCGRTGHCGGCLSTCRRIRWKRGERPPFSVFGERLPEGNARRSNGRCDADAVRLVAGPTAPRRRGRIRSGRGGHSIGG